MSINIHVNAALAVSIEGSAAANFGTMIVVGEHSVTANRQDGPYARLSDAEAAGFTASAAPAIHVELSAAFAQQTRTQQVLVGRQASAEHIADALTAIELVAPASFYTVVIASNTANDIMAAAAWVETRSKIAMLQTSDAAVLAGTASTQQVSTFTVGGTTDGVYSIACYNAWTNALVGTASYTASGDTTAQIATALRAAWDLVSELAAISSPAAGTGDDVEITFDGLGNGYTFVIVAASSMTEDTPAFVQNVGELGSALGYNRTAIVYHDSDAENLDAAWVSRCLSFNLDAPNGAGIWAYHVLSGVTATSLTSAQKTALLASNVNYYAPVTYTSGVEEAGFTYKGRMLSGRPIDVQTSMDLTQSRVEEAFLQTFIRASSVNQKISFTDEGLQLLGGTGLAVFAKLVRGAHFADDAVSSLTGRTTPYLDIPRVSSLSPAQKVARYATAEGEVVFAGAVESMGDAATVGISIKMSF